MVLDNARSLNDWISVFMINFIVFCFILLYSITFGLETHSLFNLIPMSLSLSVSMCASFL